jgi:signal peptidase I
MWLLWLTVVAVPALLAVVLRRRFAVVTVVGPSMLPTLAPGDRVLIRRAVLSELSRGQVVVIEKPGEGGNWAGPRSGWPPGERPWMIKRVAAIPGDAWPDAGRPAMPAGPGPGPAVPEGKLVVLGDNPARSYDSRQLGYFPGERLLGVMLRPIGERRREPPDLNRELAGLSEPPGTCA